MATMDPGRLMIPEYGVRLWGVFSSFSRTHDAGSATCGYWRWALTSLPSHSFMPIDEPAACTTRRLVSAGVTGTTTTVRLAAPTDDRPSLLNNCGVTTQSRARQFM